MKEQIRTLLEENPGISLVEVARTLHKDPQTNHAIRTGYWQARTLLAEDIIRTLLNNEQIRTLCDKDLTNVIRTLLRDKDLIEQNTNKDLIQEQGPYKDHKDLISKNDNLDKDLIEELPREFVYQGYKYWQGKSGAWRRRALTAPEDYWEDVERTKAESVRAIFTLGL